MIEERRAPIEVHLDSLKELRRAYLSHYRFMEGNASEEYLSSILDDVHQLEEEIMEVRKQLPPPMSQRQLRAIEDIPEVWAEVTGKKVGNTHEVSDPVTRRIRELEKRKETLYPPLVGISPFTYSEAMKDITEAVERLKKLPSDIIEYSLLPCHVETIIRNYDCLVEEDDQLWVERNIISPDMLDNIRDHAFKKVGRIAVCDMHCKMLSNGFYSSKVAKTYMEYTKRMNEEYQEMLDKAHEEALNEALHRDLWARFDKPKEEALCEAADKTLQEYADIAAGKDLEATAKRFEKAREEHGTPSWKVEHHHSGGGDKRFEGALEDVCSVEGQFEAGSWTITPVRGGFKEWIKDWFR